MSNTENFVEKINFEAFSDETLNEIIKRSQNVLQERQENKKTLENNFISNDVKNLIEKNLNNNEVDIFNNILNGCLDFNNVDYITIRKIYEMLFDNNEEYLANELKLKTLSTLKEDDEE